MADLFLGEIGWEIVVTITMERTKGLNQVGLQSGGGRR